jgi:hypothetical protein
MPSERLPSQSQGRPAHGTQRSTSSIHSQTDSPSTTPPQHTKTKPLKHVVGAGRTHARIPSNRSLVKLTKAHGNDSHTDLKKLPRNSSATSLKKNNSHTNLKRNRSSADVSKRPKSSHGPDKRPASVHFEIGDQDQDQEDGEEEWEEASSASPALSRSATRSAASSDRSSAKPSANNSEPHSPLHSPTASQEQLPNGGSEKQSARQHPADAKVITERLLQRSHSQNTATTKMSLATATPTASGHSPPLNSLEKSQTSTLNGTISTFNGTPKTGSSNNEVVSRFVSGSGTPSEASPFLQNHKPSTSTTNDGPQKKNEEVKRAQSMGNLARHNSSADDDSESALLPRSRKSSQSHAYVPPQQSRTQQKLWLQRASSNIEPQQMAPGLAINGVHAGIGAGVGTSLVGAGYDGRDPRIKLQLERTGLEYLVVRRHQDPVGQALKRLSVLPGVERNRRIPPPSQASKKGDSGEGSGRVGRYGLSQSLKEGKLNRNGKDKVTSGARSSYDGRDSSQDERCMSGRANDDEGIGAILRSLWEKNFDLSASAD